MRKLRTISISEELFDKFELAKVKQSWSLKMNLKNEDFMHLLLEGYPEPKKSKGRPTP